uniref:Uncharacterized protein n=1 Tax=viral metagenome TaxID=1070528 RepID=A0A6H1ZPR9_9ZZZZ
MVSMVEVDRAYIIANAQALLDECKEEHPNRSYIRERAEKILSMI